MIKILVVDSDENHCAKLTKILHGLSFEVSAFLSAEQIETALVKDVPPQWDIVCLIQRQNDGSSYHLCRSIRATPSLHHCPILMLSEADDEIQTERALSVGVTEIFPLDEWESLIVYLTSFRDFKQKVSGHVLLVEDSLSQQQLARAILEDVGLTVRTAVDVNTAWQLFNEETYDLVITDLVLVGSDTGLSLINRIRQLSDARAEIPIIVMSGYQDDARKVDLYRRGISEFITKPIIYEELVARSRYLVQNQKLVAKVHEHRRELGKKNRALNEFIGRISHEFRNSINIELGVARMLKKEDDLSERQTKLVAMVKSAAEHQLSLVNDILDYQKIESGTLTLAEKPCDVRALPELLMEMFSYKSEENNLTLNWQLDDDIPQRVIIDETKFKQVLINLLGNAVKFTEHGSVSLNMKLCRMNDADWLRCDVIDTGPGIPINDQQDIFLAFKQTDIGKSKRGSTGLGLAICANLSELMGGELRLKSSVGKGSQFGFSVPVLGSQSIVSY